MRAARGMDGQIMTRRVDGAFKPTSAACGGSVKRDPPYDLAPTTSTYLREPVTQTGLTSNISTSKVSALPASG